MVTSVTSGSHWMNIIRLLKSLLYRRISLLIFLLLTCVWMCGVLDHLNETSFEEFQWSPYGIDVLAETKRAIAGDFSGSVLSNNWCLFRVIKEPECRSWIQTLELLIVVKSSFINRKSRDAVRRTWGIHRNRSAVEIVFIIGKSNRADDGNEEMILDELQEHNDLLYVDFIDTYRNNTYKLLHSIAYAYHPESKCSLPKFLFLVDDDYMVNVVSLLRLVANKDPLEPLYEGWLFNTTPFRFRLHKHAVSLEIYPFDRYPPYITAGAVLLSRNSVAHFYYAMQLVKIYPYDDVYAGILAYLLRIPPTHNDAFVFWSRHISKEEWMRGDVIAAHGYPATRLLEEFPSIVHVS